MKGIIILERITKISRIINATPDKIYKAFTNRIALESWLVPGDMISKIHDFDFRIGGGYTMSLFYPESHIPAKGKTLGNEDRYTTKFIDIIPESKIVQTIKFDSSDPSFSEEMKMIVTIGEGEDGTNVTFLFENIPNGISMDDNEMGTKLTLEKLARFVE